MQKTQMEIKIILPSGIFIEQKDILRIVAETTIGSVGLLPQRLDCVASLVPGIIFFESESLGEKFVAVDEGVLAKTGSSVLVSVRRAIAGESLEELRQSVEAEFMNLSEREYGVRESMDKMESSLIHHLVQIKNE